MALNLYAPSADPWDAEALAAADALVQRIARTMSLRAQLTALAEPESSVEPAHPPVESAAGTHAGVSPPAAEHAPPRRPG